MCLKTNNHVQYTIYRLTDMGQFQHLTGLKGPQEGTYLYTTQFLLLR